MSHSQQPPAGKDPELWEAAQERAGFKSHLVTYVIVNGFFWALWFFGGDNDGNNEGMPWPVWSMLSWGIGLAFHYASVYMFSKADLVEKEYQKLKNKQ